MKKTNPYRCLLGILTTVATVMSAHSEIPRAVPEGRAIADPRLAPPKDLNGYFPFTPPTSLDEWEHRKSEVVQRLRVSTGLWPAPTKTPLHPVVHGRLDMGDYTVEKVYFESVPGFYVTGSLFRPTGLEGKRPGVLCPHGHWPNGRFYDAGEKEALNQIAMGAERFVSAARNPMQARCVQLARMGCVVFQYDMIGYADSLQIPQSIAHGFSKQRPGMNHEGHWGLFSVRAENRLQSVMGLQTWSSIRALDFLESLPDVDPQRLAVTGASGGGTQTFMLAALDPRIRVAFPAVMVSTAMQGGCTCENACLLRIETGNVEMAALFAPNPLGLTSANDWTKEMETKGFPELQKLYGLYSAKDRLHLTPLTHFGHNYNHVSRTAMYRWMNRHLDLGLPEPVLESDFTRLGKEDLTVWEGRSQPETGASFEASLLKKMDQNSSSQMRQLSVNMPRFTETMRTGWETIVGRSMDTVGEVDWEITHKKQKAYGLEMAGLLRNLSHEETVPALFLHPDKGKGDTILWVHPKGKSSLLKPDGDPTETAAEWLRKGYTLAGIDLFMQGECLEYLDGASDSNRLVKTDREFAGYSFGYNHGVFARRVHDLLTLISFVHSNERQRGKMILVGMDGGGKWAAPALAIAPGKVSKAVIHTDDFDFDLVEEFTSADFLPGSVRYLGLAGALSVAGPLPIEVDSPALLQETSLLTASWAAAPELRRLSPGEWISWLSE